MTAIVCVSQSWGIGRDGALLFRISADHKRFRALTVGKTVILGHKTLDTFPGGKPLKDRRNIVLSHRDLDVPGAEIAHSFDAAAALGGDDAIVIGGASVYMALLSRCDRVYVTKVDADSWNGLQDRKDGKSQSIPGTEKATLYEQLSRFLPDRALSLAYGGGVESYNRTWTSSTERAAFEDLGW